MGKLRVTLIMEDDGNYVVDADRGIVTSPNSGIYVESLERLPDPPRRQTFEVTTRPIDDPFTWVQIRNALRATGWDTCEVREVTQ